VKNGQEEASEVVEGELDNFFALVKELSEKIRKRLNVPVALEQPSSTPSPLAPSLETYKLLLEGEGETSAAKPPKTEQTPLQNRPDKGSEKHSRISPQQGWFVPSMAWADETSPQGATAEEEVRQVLEKYREAYEKKDPDLLATVYQTFTPAQQEANAQYFQNTQDLRVTISDVDITVQGDEAAVSYTREDQFTDAKTKQKVKLDVRFTKIFVRTDGGWKMVVGKR
jgi:ketosteroid isomerase-like protein